MTNSTPANSNSGNSASHTNTHPSSTGPLTPLPPRMTTRLAHGVLATRNEDGSITLEMPQPLTLQAEELEELVTDLAGMRAELDPPYPLDCPPLCALEPCYTPRHWVACDPLTGKILLFLRHHLFGWLGIVQTPEGALEMLKSVAVEMKKLELSERNPGQGLH
jgi:hypothetical protein